MVIVVNIRTIHYFICYENYFDIKLNIPIINILISFYSSSNEFLRRESKNFKYKLECIYARLLRNANVNNNTRH